MIFGIINNIFIGSVTAFGLCLTAEPRISALIKYDDVCFS